MLPFSDAHIVFLIHGNGKLPKHFYSLKRNLFCDLETFVLIEIELIHHIHNSYRGFIFLITLFIFLVFFILFINIYTYYKQQQRNKYLKYHRLNQIDAGQFHQWYDIAQYLNANKYTNNYNLICNYLKNLQSTTNLTNRLMEYHT
ncbi:unnamed protein product [Rotaria sp. Silwood1]|nr:unnamed protein product [Rotaria sp. Silwood1]